MRVAALFLLCSCAWWQPTPAARARREIGAWLKHCLRSQTVGVDARLPASCYAAENARCALAKLPDCCARFDLFVDCATQSSSGEPGTLPPSASCNVPPDCRLDGNGNEVNERDALLL